MSPVHRLLLAVIFVGTVRPASADDACSDVLRIGLTDSYSLARSSSLNSALDQWLCSSASNDALIDANVAASIPVPELAGIIGANFDVSKVDTWRSSQCSRTTAFLDATQAVSVAVAVLSPVARDAIAAWRACTLRGAATNGVSAKIGDYAANDPTFTVTFDWQPTKQQPTRPTLVEFQTINASCTGPPVPGTEFADRVMVCRRDGDRRAMFVVNTSAGPVNPTPVLPEVAKPPPPKPDCYAAPCRVAKFTIPSASAQPMPGNAAIFELRPAKGRPRVSSGDMELEGSVTFTVEAATPTWSNSPYTFAAQLELDGVQIASHTWTDSAHPKEASLTFTWTLPLVRVKRPRDTKLSMVLKISSPANWTYRSGEFGNPPDRVRLDRATIEVDSQPFADD